MNKILSLSSEQLQSDLLHLRPSISSLAMLPCVVLHKYLHIWASQRRFITRLIIPLASGVLTRVHHASQHRQDLRSHLKTNIFAMCHRSAKISIMLMLKFDIPVINNEVISGYIVGSWRSRTPRHCNTFASAFRCLFMHKSSEFKKERTIAICLEEKLP